MHKFTIGVLLSFAVLGILGCSSPKLNQLQPGDVVLAFGDSLTEGVGVSAENSYPTVLANLTGRNVINAGISGETTAEGLQRFPDVLAKYSPRLIILLEGGNDILRNKSAAETRQNLDSMIQIAKGRGIQVVLIGVPEKKLFSSSAPLYEELAEKHDLVFDSDIIGSLMRSPSMKSDAVHFNKAGYRSMAESIYELLSENGAF